MAIVVNPAMTADSDHRAAIALACNTADRPSRDMVAPDVGAMKVQVTSIPKTLSPRIT